MILEYEVSVGDKHYVLNVHKKKVIEEPDGEKIKDQTTTTLKKKKLPKRIWETDNPGVDIALEAIKNEYDYSLSRADKLDNKVYILLTICAFVFALSMNAISKIRLIVHQDIWDIFKSYFVPKSSITPWIRWIYLLLLFILLVLIIVILASLISLLKSKVLDTLDVYSVRRGDLFSMESVFCATLLSELYTSCIEKNNKLIDEKYKKFDRCTICLGIYILVAVIEEIIGSYL